MAVWPPCWATSRERHSSLPAAVQEYCAHRYGVVESCIENGINYLDFADAADFVFGISQYDDGAKAAGIFVLSGVSSFPVLTAAVLREMAKDMDLISVEGGIAPSPFAGVGVKIGVTCRS